MVPDLKRTVPLDLAHNAVRSGDTVVGGLENTWDLFRNGNGKDEQIY
jgi:hypothetical protein